MQNELGRGGKIRFADTQHKIRPQNLLQRGCLTERPYIHQESERPDHQAIANLNSEGSADDDPEKIKADLAFLEEKRIVAEQRARNAEDKLASVQRSFEAQKSAWSVHLIQIFICYLRLSKVHQRIIVSMSRMVALVGNSKQRLQGRASPSQPRYPSPPVARSLNSAQSSTATAQVPGASAPVGLIPTAIAHAELRLAQVHRIMCHLQLCRFYCISFNSKCLW